MAAGTRLVLEGELKSGWTLNLCRNVNWQDWLMNRMWGVESGVQGDLKVFGLSNWKDEAAIYWGEKNSERSQFGGEIWNSILVILRFLCLLFSFPWTCVSFNYLIPNWLYEVQVTSETFIWSCWRGSYYIILEFMGRSGLKVWIWEPSAHRLCLILWDGVRSCRQWR